MLPKTNTPQYQMTSLPTFDELMNPLLEALQRLGGSGSIEEIYAKTVEITGLPDEILAQLHDPEKSSQTEVGYRLAWARTYLRKFGLLETQAEVSGRSRKKPELRRASRQLKLFASFAHLINRKRLKSAQPTRPLAKYPKKKDGRKSCRAY